LEFGGRATADRNPFQARLARAQSRSGMACAIRSARTDRRFFFDHLIRNTFRLASRRDADAIEWDIKST
jgi:hypothetical protein